MSRPDPSQRSDFKIWCRFTTRWADNDAYGHVNNTVYYEWFDSAVNAWLVSEGILDIEHGNPIALVVRTCCSYFAPIAFPRDVETGLAVSKIGRSSIHYRIGVFTDSGDSAASAQGEFVHVVVDRVTKRPVEIPPSWRTKLEAIR